MFWVMSFTDTLGLVLPHLLAAKHISLETMIDPRAEGAYSACREPGGYLKLYNYCSRIITLFKDILFLFFLGRSS